MADIPEDVAWSRAERWSRRQTARLDLSRGTRAHDLSRSETTTNDDDNNRAIHAELAFRWKLSPLIRHVYVATGATICLCHAVRLMFYLHSSRSPEAEDLCQLPIWQTALVWLAMYSNYECNCNRHRGLSVFRRRLKAFLFIGVPSHDFHRNFSSACAVTVVIFGHFNRSFYLRYLLWMLGNC